MTKQKTGTLLWDSIVPSEYLVYCKKDQKADIDISTGGEEMKNAPASGEGFEQTETRSIREHMILGILLPGRSVNWKNILG